MVYNAYYIYSLKDPRRSPAIPFYIGKGTGVRAWDHVLKTDNTLKGRRIAEIQAEGHEVIVTKLAENLTEAQALQLEAELIIAFGTERTGGILTNSVVPSGSVNRSVNKVTIPYGAPEKAQLGVKLLKEAVLELAQANKGGIQNADAVKALGLQSDYKGGSKDYLTWSILGLLMKEGKMKRVENSRKHISTVK